MRIYEAKDKSFEADLIVGDSLIHVKSQDIESATRYGASWLFQKKDKLLTVPGDNEFIAFCIVNDLSVDIKGIVLAKDLVKNNLVSEPKVARYTHTKNALYLQNILDSDIIKNRF
jgi:hypothetical protein